jgi:hypothetical protein
MRTFRHSGKLGDIIWSLPFIRHMGGGDLRIEIGVLENGAPRISPDGFRSIQSLLQAQSYIQSVEPYEGGAVDFDLDAFRNMMPWSGCNLVDAYYLAHGLAPDQANHVEPWLEVPELPLRCRKGVVVTRTPRYLEGRPVENPFFHNMVRQGLGKHGLFVGSRDEHSWFERMYRVQIEYVETKDAIEAASILDNADLWVGNENFIGALAEGLKKTTVRELNMYGTNEKLFCTFRRPNLFYI